MRFLHTSDWHLGQDFYRFDRSHEQRRFLSWLTETLAETRTDVLLIAGDVFDVAHPSAAAQRLFYEFLVDAKRRCPHLQTLVIAGNHDSGARLEAPAEVLTTLDVRVVGRVQSTPTGLESAVDVLVPYFEPGKAKEAPEVVFLLVPFLKAADVQWPVDRAPGRALYGQTGRESDRILYSDRVLRTYEQAIRAARERFGTPVPLIALGHLHASGGQSSLDSERRLLIGGEEAVPLGRLAADVSYFGLGHLHLAQSVAGHEHLRYSGSPYPLSFSEIHYPHSVVLVDVDPKVSASSAALQLLRVPRTVPLVRCPAVAKTMTEVLQELSELHPPSVPLDEQPFLEVQILLTGPVPDLRNQVEKALDGKALRLAKISVSRPAAESASGDDPFTQRPRVSVGLEELRALEPEAILRDVHVRRYRVPPDEELMETFREALRRVGDLGESADQEKSRRPAP